MNNRRYLDSRRLSLLCGLLLTLAVSRRTCAQPAPEATAAFNSYVTSLEARLGLQHGSPQTFLAPLAADGEPRLRRGEPILEQLTPQHGTSPPGAMLHHWRGTAFVAGATAGGFERLLRDFNAYPQRFAPEVLQARVVTRQDDEVQAWMRVRQKHVLTVVLDTTYNVAFGRLNPEEGFSASRSTRIYEIDAPGTDRERALSEKEEHGFLWRLNTYWTYEERDGGLYIQIESVSLSRSIPAGLGWALRPYVESVPRESLEFTLRSVCQALQK